jgi:hypothetical protein
MVTFLGIIPAGDGRGALLNQEYFRRLLAGLRPGGRLTFLCFAKEK